MCNFAAENEKYSINCRQRAGKIDVTFMNLRGFQPKLFSTLKNGYDKQTLVQDLLAGVIVGNL